MKVRAKVTHIEPKTQRYRTEGEVFDTESKLYKHVEPVKNQNNEDAEEKK